MHMKSYELTVPKQNITIKVKHVNIDVILDTVYAKNKSKEEIKNEIQKSLQNIIQ